MKVLLTVFVFSLGSLFAGAQTGSGFALTQTFKIGSPGGWDYISVGPDSRVYVSHGTQVNILDQKTGDSLGFIPNTTGVHGIAFDPASGKGYTSNGRLNTVTVFDLKTTAILGQIAPAQKPDATLHAPFYQNSLPCKGRNLDLSVIDAAPGQVTSTITLDGN